MTGWAPLLHTYISGLWHQTTIDVPHRVWMLLYDTPLVYLSLVGLSSRSCAEFNKGNWSPVVNLTAQMCCLFHHTAAAAAAHPPIYTSHGNCCGRPRFALNFECFTTVWGLIILITEPIQRKEQVDASPTLLHPCIIQERAI